MDGDVWGGGGSGGGGKKGAEGHERRLALQSSDACMGLRSK